MADAKIHLPNDLHALAAAHCMQTGHSTLQGYIIHLIREDLHRHSAHKPKPQSEDSRKRKASLETVRPSFPTRRRHMPPAIRESFHKIRKRLLNGMMSYMKATEDPGYGYACGYQLKHIDRCSAIINAFLSELATAHKGEPKIILKITERTVMKLNKLNSSCDRALIQTDQREDLCNLISTAIAKKGLKTIGDITEAWREW